MGTQWLIETSVKYCSTGGQGGGGGVQKEPFVVTPKPRCPLELGRVAAAKPAPGVEIQSPVGGEAAGPPSPSPSPSADCFGKVAACKVAASGAALDGRWSNAAPRGEVGWCRAHFSPSKCCPPPRDVALPSTVSKQGCLGLLG